MTALAATPIAPTATNPPAIRVDVTGAPNAPTTAYTSSFTAGVDGWAVGSGSPAGTTVTNDTAGTIAALYVRKPYPAVANTLYYAQRVVSGLTVGTTYKFRAAVRRVDSGQVRLSVVGSTTGAWVTGSASRAFIEISFTATATSHTLVIGVQWTGNPLGAAPGYNVDTITVTPSSTWPGTRVQRTDANGVNVPVRLPAAGLDVVAGAMTLYDLEAALYGPVTYRVIDGAGGITTAVTAHGIAGARTNLVVNPSGENLTTNGWVASPRGTITAFAFPSAARAGAAIFRYQNSGVTTGGEYVGTANMAVTAGVPVTGSAWMLPYGPGSQVRVYIQWYDAANAIITGTTSYGAAVSGGTNEWVRPFVTATPPALATAGRLFVENIALPLNGTYRWDAVMFEQTDQLRDYFDGDYVDPAGKATAAWLGQFQYSASIQLEPADSPGPWLSTPAFDTIPTTGQASGVPVPSVLNYDETEERGGELRQVIGRRDPVGNPGVMSLRRGQLSLWFADYGDARAARLVLERGQTCMIRQPDYPGLDLYFLPARVKLEPASLDTATIRWQVTLDYDEVAAP